MATDDIVCTPDLFRVAAIKKIGEKTAVVYFDGSDGPQFSYIPRIVWRPEHNAPLHLLGHHPPGKEPAQWLLGLPGKPGSTISLIFSPDSRRLAYIGAVKKGSGGSEPKSANVVVVDGKVGPEFDEIYPHNLVFSPTSNRLAYIASRGTQVFLIVEGVSPQVLAGPPSFMRYDMQFSRDGKRVAWIDSVSPGAAAAVVDGLKKKTYVKVTGLSFSPDSSQFAYIAETSGEQYIVVINESEEGPYEGVLDLKVYWNPSSREVAYVAGVRTTGGMEAQLMRANKLLAKGQTFRAITYSPDGQRFAYGVVETDKAGQRKAYMVVDGQRSAGYDGLGKEASFSPDSKRFAYLVGIPAVEGKDLKEALVMDGKVEGRYDSIAASPAWSPNSRHYAYWATQEDKTLVIKDGIALGKYDFATALVFSSDSAHLAWWAKVGAWYRLVVDGQPVGSPYSSCACSFGLKVDANGVRGVAVKEKDVRQISVQWR